jgi:hypothetical protein
MKFSPVMALLVATFVLGPANALAQQDEEKLRDPFKGVLELVEWFKKLNDDFDQLVVIEKKAQLERAVDRLGKSLYAYELDIAFFKNEIPWGDLAGDEKNRIRVIESKSRITLIKLAEAVRGVGAEVRLNDGIEVERTLTYGLNFRGKLWIILRTPSKTGPGMRPTYGTGLIKG